MTKSYSRSSHNDDINASLLSFIMTTIITDLQVCHDSHHYCISISPSSAEIPPWSLCAVCEKLSTCYPSKHHFGRDWPFSLSLVYLTLIHWLLPLQPHLQRIVNNFCPDFPTPEEKKRVRMILAAVHHLVDTSTITACYFSVLHCIYIIAIDCYFLFSGLCSVRILQLVNYLQSTKQLQI